MYCFRAFYLVVEMVAHAGTLSVFGRHGRRSDRRAAGTGCPRSTNNINPTRRRSVPFTRRGQHRCVQDVDCVRRYFGSRLTVTLDHGGGTVRRNIRQHRHFDSLAEKTVCVGQSVRETDRQIDRQRDRERVSKSE